MEIAQNTKAAMVFIATVRASQIMQYLAFNHFTFGATDAHGSSSDSVDESASLDQISVRLD
jgi:hypothetical protein